MTQFNKTKAVMAGAEITKALKDEALTEFELQYLIGLMIKPMMTQVPGITPQGWTTDHILLGILNQIVLRLRYSIHKNIKFSEVWEEACQGFQQHNKQFEEEFGD